MSELLTDVEYWNRVWDGRSVPRPLDPSDRTLNNFMNIERHLYFQSVMKLIGASKGFRLIEIGCGGSIVLPYFHREYGFHIAGLDYSPNGYKTCCAINSLASVPADIRQGDMFNAPADMIGAFDIVYSSGLAEHFLPTTKVMKVIGQFCKPGGHIITIIPNLTGVIGFLQRLLNKPIYDVHVPLNLNELVQAHRDCGFDVVDARLIGTINLNVVNFSGDGSLVPLQIGQRLTSWASKSVWILRRLGMPDIPSHLFSPYFACVAEKNAKP